jgi:mono/diheme cytochrome c family protein
MRFFLAIAIAVFAASWLAARKTDADVKTTAPPTVDAELSPADRQEASLLIDSACSTCHSQELLEQQRLTRKQWEASVKKMQTWGAPLEPERTALVARVLSEMYHPSLPVYQPRTVDARAVARSLAPMPDGPFARGDATLGATLYQSYCMSCHGENGVGSGLGPRLLDQAMLFRAREVMALVTQGRGRMPALPQLTTRQVAALLAYLRTAQPDPTP